MIPPRRILLLQLRAIGDVILTTPALRVLKRHFPQADIDFIVNPAPAEVLFGNPHLRQVIVYPYQPNDLVGLVRFAQPLRRNQYDVTIDYLGTVATAFLSWRTGATMRLGYNLRWRKLAYTHLEQNYSGSVYNALTKFSLLKPLGISQEETRTEVFIPTVARIWAGDFFQQQGLSERSVIAIAPQAKRPARRWLPERFAEVADRLQQQGFKILLLWGPGEQEFVAAVQRLIHPLPLLSPPTSLLQCAALLKRCRLLIGNCGGVKHLAVAVGTPTLTIYGPTDPRVWTPPDDPRHAIVRAELDCLVCGKQECQPLRCMEEVTAEMVLQRIQESGILG